MMCRYIFISDPATKIITTAVRESQLHRIAPLIAGGLQKRGKDSPLFIIACENGHRCSSRVLAEEVKKYLPPDNFPGGGKQR